MKEELHGFLFINSEKRAMVNFYHNNIEERARAIDIMRRHGWEDKKTNHPSDVCLPVSNIAIFEYNNPNIILYNKDGSGYYVWSSSFEKNHASKEDALKEIRILKNKYSLISPGGNNWHGAKAYREWKANK